MKPIRYQNRSEIFLFAKHYVNLWFYRGGRRNILRSFLPWYSAFCLIGPWWCRVALCWIRSNATSCTSGCLTRYTLTIERTHTCWFGDSIRKEVNPGPGSILEMCSCSRSGWEFIQSRRRGYQRCRGCWIRNLWLRIRQCYWAETEYERKI